MKKLISLCFAMLLALALTAPAGASDAPRTIQVQLNGRTVTFPDAAPESVNGRTMVPMRAVLEALGAEVDYDAGTAAVTAALGGLTITHTVGTDKIDIDGQEPLTMDTVSYARDGRTMVPLRFFSQALGYEVYWDGGAYTAVVIDKKSAIDAINQNFTVLNGVQARQAAILGLSGNASAETSVSGELKLPDADAMPFSMKLSTLRNASAMNVDGTMDLSAFSGLIGGGDETIAAMAGAMLKEMSFHAICGNDVYFQIPALTSILRMSGQDLPQGDVWMKSEGTGMASMSASTVGEMVYAMVEYMDGDVPVNLYDDLIQVSGQMAELIADGTFTQDGEDSVWVLDGEKAAALEEALGSAGADLHIAAKMTIKADGGYDFSLDMSAEKAVVSLSAASDGTSGSVTGQLRMEDVCEMTFQCESKIQASDKVPVSEPGGDAAIVDLDEYGTELLDGAGLGVIGGADGPTSIFTAA